MTADELKQAMEWEECPMENKCDTCANNFPTCQANKIVWGIDRDPSARGEEADMVLECDAYRSREKTMTADNWNKKIELEALITERDGMTADNEWKKSIGRNLVYAGDDFFVLAEKIRALKERP